MSNDTLDTDNHTNSYNYIPMNIFNSDAKNGVVLKINTPEFSIFEQ